MAEQGGRAGKGAAESGRARAGGWIARTSSSGMEGWGSTFFLED
jgi:hypothetical protein